MVNVGKYAIHWMSGYMKGWLFMVFHVGKYPKDIACIGAGFWNNLQYSMSWCTVRHNWFCFWKNGKFQGINFLCRIFKPLLIWSFFSVIVETILRLQIENPSKLKWLEPCFFQCYPLPPWLNTVGIHPGKLTWNLKITYLKRKNNQTCIFGFHLRFLGYKIISLHPMFFHGDVISNQKIIMTSKPTGCIRSICLSTWMVAFCMW